MQEDVDERDVPDLFPLGRLALGGDPLQHADHVHVAFALDHVAFPIAGLARGILPQDANAKGRGMAVRATTVRGTAVAGLTVGFVSVRVVMTVIHNGKPIEN